ncbi:MAG: biopolymer transporter ExbD, partial [Candidatus Zixiibacteriota bacterium]
MAGKRRVSIKIDMTPMVDIAFLLLIFYMATTQFKPPEAKAVELPSSHSMIELP